MVILLKVYVAQHLLLVWPVFGIRWVLFGSAIPVAARNLRTFVRNRRAASVFSEPDCPVGVSFL